MVVVIKFQYKQEIRRVTVDNFGFSFSQLQGLANNLFGNTLPKELSFKYKDDENDMITVSSEQELQEAIRLATNQQILRIYIEDAKPVPKSNSNSKPDDFLGVLEKLLVENPFVKSFIDNFDIDVKSIPTDFSMPFDVKIDVVNPESPRHCTRGVPLTPIRPVHNAICDACDSGIVGIRYKCNQCPDYDLCENCEVHKENVHLKDHSFEKITHSTPSRGCQRNNSSSNSNSNGSRCPRNRGFGCARTNIPQNEVIHPAICDGCKNRIQGIRNKCVTCPDYDLCSKCLDNKIHSEHKFQTIEKPYSRCTRFDNLRRTAESEKKEEVKEPVPQSFTTTQVEAPKVVESTKIEVKVESPKVEVKKVEEPKVEVAKIESPKVEVKKVEEPKVEVQPIPAPTPVQLTPFEIRLKQLEEMGFVNKQKNIELLVRFKGDMLQTVKVLLEN